MAIALQDCREYITDQPAVYPPPSASPEQLGIGDGAATLFYLSYPNITAGSLTVYFGAYSTIAGVQTLVWTAQNPNTYVQSGTTPQQITFNAAVAAGTLVGARYMATAISDTALTGIMNRNVARYVDDQTALKGVLNDYLDILLSDLELIKLVRYADYIEDARQVVQGYDKIKAQIMAELEGNPRPGKAIPTMIHVSGPSPARWGMRR